MELVPGRTLREILKHCARVTGPMPLRLALNILNQICDALDYAHNLTDDAGKPLGIIHRDVSPSNIIVSDSGVVKLIDFGIAKASLHGLQTMTGTLKGKFGYMAPEYIGGRIDARADLFALGIVAHEMLTNQPLFQGSDDMETLLRVKQMPIPPPSHVNRAIPPEIDAIVMTALARDPEQRWQHANALRTALTTETKRVGAVALNAHVVEWVEWAFEQGREPSEPSISIERGTAALQPPRASQPQLAASRTDLERTRIRPNKKRSDDIDDAPTSKPLKTVSPDEFDDGPNTTVPRAPLQVDEFDDQPPTTPHEPRMPLSLPPPLAPRPVPRPSPAPMPLAPMPLAPMPLAPQPLAPALAPRRPSVPLQPPIAPPLQPSDALRPSASMIPQPPPQVLRPSVPLISQYPQVASPYPPAVPEPPPADSSSHWGVWAALAILIVAVAAGAVVYFWPTP
jgi:serine/threonine protein kinase